MEFKQSVINIILIAVFLLLSVFVFVQKQYVIKSDMPNEGEIFASAKSTGAASAVQSIKETDLFGQEKPAEKYIEINELSQTQAQGGQVSRAFSSQGAGAFQNIELKEIVFYSSLANIPEKFIGKKTDDKERSEFSIYLTSAAAEQIIAQIKTDKAAKKQVGKDAKKQNNKAGANNASVSNSSSSKAENAKTQKDKDGQAKKEAKKELDFSILNKAVKDSKLTFFYPYNFKTLNNVSVGILSITPYEENQHIIKFEIKNNTQNFFIAANISVKSSGKQVLVRKFFDNVVGKKSDKQGILLMPQFKSGDTLSVTFLENGGRNRTYTIDLKIP
jgi:hypothetical protein